MENSDSTKKKKIAIIGAGGAGLCSISSLKEEGFEPVCFEFSDSYGGLWNYREEAVEGFGSLMPTTILNHSKEMGALSTFPPKKECSNYMRHKEYFQYITDFYKHFECEKHIRFNTEVISVKKAEDYAETGRLSVTVRDTISEKVSTHVFDGVMVATGHFSYPKVETFPGLENFKGEVIHTHSLKKVDNYKDKNVLVIGAGCSGLDAAEFISSVANQVYLSVRSGMFVLNRLGPNGYPIDYLLYRRHRTIIALEYLPINFSSWFMETFYMDSKFDHSLYYVKPKYNALARDPVLNEAIAYKLLSGSVVQKGAVKEFTENGVLFDGDDTVTEIDAVIMATGYTFKFPFLEDGLLEIEDGRINLYKCMYPTHLPHSSLAFIAFLNPFGPGAPIVEMQCRFAAFLFAGKGKLPSNEAMLADAIERHRRNLLRYVPSEYMSVRVDVNFADELASKIGCKPNLLKYLLTDFRLFLKLMFGPSLSYQYRLEGPHKWDGAREAIMSCEDRIRWPLSREKRWRKGVLQLIFEYLGNLIPRNML